MWVCVCVCYEAMKQRGKKQQRGTSSSFKGTEIRGNYLKKLSISGGGGGGGGGEVR